MQENETQFEEILTRISRIEKAILGDDEHGIWGYKRKLEHYMDKLADLEINTMQRFDEIQRHISREITILDKRIDKNQGHIMKSEGFEKAVIVIAGLIGGLLGALITMIFKA